MKALKAIGRWFGSMFVVCDWHEDGAASAVGSEGKAWGHNRPLTPELIAREPNATPVPPPAPQRHLVIKHLNVNPNPPPRTHAPQVTTRVVRRVQVIMLTQTFSSSAWAGLHHFRDNGFRDAQQVLDRYWLGVGTSNVLVWGANYLDTFRDLIRASVEAAGGMHHEFEVCVTWHGQSPFVIAINTAHEDWMNQFALGYQAEVQRRLR